MEAGSNITISPNNFLFSREISFFFPRASSCSRIFTETFHMNSFWFINIYIISVIDEHVDILRAI